jgi:Flp pilus assembly pilin Flp
MSGTLGRSGLYRQKEVCGAVTTPLTGWFRRAWRVEQGQTMAEYGVILAVITLATIGALTALSSGVQATITSIVNTLN